MPPKSSQNVNKREWCRNPHSWCRGSRLLVPWTKPSGETQWLDLRMFSGACFWDQWFGICGLDLAWWSSLTVVKYVLDAILAGLKIVCWINSVQSQLVNTRAMLMLWWIIGVFTYKEDFSASGHNHPSTSHRQVRLNLHQQYLRYSSADVWEIPEVMIPKLIRNPNKPLKAWQEKTLAFTRRLTNIIETFSNLPYYFISCGHGNSSNKLLKRRGTWDFIVLLMKDYENDFFKILFIISLQSPRFLHPVSFLLAEHLLAYDVVLCKFMKISTSL